MWRKEGKEGEKEGGGGRGQLSGEGARLCLYVVNKVDGGSDINTRCGEAHVLLTRGGWVVSGYEQRGRMGLSGLYCFMQPLMERMSGRETWVVPVINEDRLCRPWTERDCGRRSGRCDGRRKIAAGAGRRG